MENQPANQERRLRRTSRKRSAGCVGTSRVLRMESLEARSMFAADLSMMDLRVLVDETANDQMEVSTLLGAAMGLNALDKLQPISETMQRKATIDIAAGDSIQLQIPISALVDAQSIIDNPSITVLYPDACFVWGDAEEEIDGDERLVSSWTPIQSEEESLPNDDSTADIDSENAWMTIARLIAKRDVTVALTMSKGSNGGSETDMADGHRFWVIRVDVIPSVKDVAINGPMTSRSVEFLPNKFGGLSPQTTASNPSQNKDPNSTVLIDKPLSEIGSHSSSNSASPFVHGLSSPQLETTRAVSVGSTVLNADPASTYRSGIATPKVNSSGFQTIDITAPILEKHRSAGRWVSAVRAPLQPMASDTSTSESDSMMRDDFGFTVTATQNQSHRRWNVRIANTRLEPVPFLLTQPSQTKSNIAKTTDVLFASQDHWHACEPESDVLEPRPLRFVYSQSPVACDGSNGSVIESNGSVGQCGRTQSAQSAVAEPTWVRFRWLAACKTVSESSIGQFFVVGALITALNSSDLNTAGERGAWAWFTRRKRRPS